MTDETKTKKPLNLVSLSERVPPAKTYVVTEEMVGYLSALLDSLKEPKPHEINEGVLFKAIEMCEVIISGQVTQLVQVGVGENYILKNISGYSNNPFMMDSALRWITEDYSVDLSYAAGFRDTEDDTDD